MFDSLNSSFCFICLNRTKAASLFYDTYKPTVKLSSYLTSFAVWEYSNVTTGFHSAFARPQAIDENKMDFALTVANSSVKILTMFGLPHTIEKLDHVAIPDGYFVYSAMENYGMITYKERSVFNDAQSTTEEIERVATVVTHEVTHQVLSNLVTPEWWNQVWLSEGFSTFMEYIVVNSMFLGWRVSEQFIINSVNPALLADSLESTRALTQDAGTPEEILNLFDFVAYDKGAAVFKMLSVVVGSTLFNSALANFSNTQ